MLQTIIKPHREKESLQQDELQQRLTDIHPALQLKPSKRARRIALRLDTKKRVMNLVLPLRMSLTRAEKFALTHKTWIAEKIGELPDTVPFTDGAVIPVYGRDVTIKINYSDALKSTSIKLINNDLIVSTNKEDSTPRILRFLKKEAQDTLENLAREKAAEIGETVNNVTLRDTKSRWGSCSSDGNISLSWRLIFAPWDAMDYVVAHEVAHLVHMDHSKRFWTLCAELSENYSTGKKWMREHGSTLMRYGA